MFSGIAPCQSQVMLGSGGVPALTLKPSELRSLLVSTGRDFTLPGCWWAGASLWQESSEGGKCRGVDAPCGGRGGRGGGPSLRSGPSRLPALAGPAGRRWEGRD